MLLTATALCGALPAAAQGPQPGGTVSDQFERPPVPQSRPPARFRIETRRQDGPAATDMRFPVTRIVVDGGGLVPESEIAALTSPLEGREASFADLQALADRITALHARAGYALTFAIVPEQDVESGVVRLRIVQGVVDTVAVEFRDGATPLVGRARIEAAIRARLSGLVGTGPVRSAQLERAVLAISDLAGLETSVVVRPSANAGAATLRVIVGTRPISAAIGADNRLRSEFGREEVYGSVTLASFASVGDRLDLSTRGSVDGRGFVYHAIGYDSPIGHGLTRGYASFSRARTDASSGLLGLLDYRGREDSFAVGVRHSLIRSRAQSFHVSAEFSGIDTSSSLFGVELVRDRIRTASFNLTYDWADATGAASVFSATFVQGIDGLDASARNNPLRSRATGEPDAAYVSLRLYRDQPIVAGLRLRANLETQVLVGGHLLAASECTYGGPAIGRAYDAGILSGDECVRASVELARQLPVFGQVIEPYFFLDAGRTFQRGPLEFGEIADANASAIGAGIRLFTRAGLSGDVQLSQPLTRTFAGDTREPRFFFTLTFRR